MIRLNYVGPFWMIIAAWLVMAASAAEAAHHTVCEIELIPNPGFENRNPASGSCEFDDLQDWYASRLTPELRTNDSAACSESADIVSSPIEGNAWVLLRSTDGIINPLADEAISTRLTEPMRVGCAYITVMWTGTKNPLIPGPGWMQVTTSLNPGLFPSEMMSGCGAQLQEPYGGCRAVATKLNGISNYGKWVLDQHVGWINADEPYEYMHFMSTFGYHVVLDNIRVHSPEALAADLVQPPSTCSELPITFDGSASEWLETAFYHRRQRIRPSRKISKT